VKLIVIDVLIISALMFIGQMVAGFIVPLMGSRNMALFAGLSNFVFGTLAFALTGMRAPNGNRWPHLMLVAAMVWLTGLLNVAINNFSFGLWLLSLAFVGLWMVLGGLISMRIKRHP
jgi:hypothetical protein